MANHAAYCLENVPHSVMGDLARVLCVRRSLLRRLSVCNAIRIHTHHNRRCPWTAHTTVHVPLAASPPPLLPAADTSSCPSSWHSYQQPWPLGCAAAAGVLGLHPTPKLVHGCKVGWAGRQAESWAAVDVDLQQTAAALQETQHACSTAQHISSTEHEAESAHSRVHTHRVRQQPQSSGFGVGWVPTVLPPTLSN